MSNSLKDKLNDIPIPEDIDKSIELGFKKAQKELRRRKMKKTFIYLAASLALILSFVGIVGFDKVEAAIKRALQYIPGYNVLVDTEEGKVLALKEQVKYEKDDVYVVINAALKLGKDFNISIESNFKDIDNTEVLLKDKAGNIVSSKNWGRAGGGDFWQGDYYFEVEDEYNNYTLVLGDIEVPFTLEETEEVEGFLQLGSHSTDKGISIVAIKKPLEDNLLISLLNQAEGKIVEDYPFENNLWISQVFDFEKSMYILDKEGHKIYPDIPLSFSNLMSDFYFDIPDQEGLKLVLPYVKVFYPDIKTDKIKIRKLKDGEVQSINKELQLGRFSIEVIEAKTKGEEIVISFKINSLEDEIIDSIKVKGIDGYGLGLNEDTGNMELFIDKKDAGKIYFASPTTVLLGDWVIDLD